MNEPETDRGTRMREEVSRAVDEAQRKAGPADYAARGRPLLERIATMLGKGTWAPIYGAGGGAALTVQDVSAAVSCARRYTKAGRRDVPLPGCVRQELLLLKWGQRADVLPQVAMACAAQMLSGGDVPITRSAALLAAQMVRGKQADTELSAWVLATSEGALRREVGNALAWMHGELSEAERAYLKALRNWSDFSTEAPTKKKPS